MLTKNYFKGYVTSIGYEEYNTTTIVNQTGAIYTANSNLRTYGSLPTGDHTINFIKAAKGNVKSRGIVFANGNAAESPDDYQMSGEHFTTYNATYERVINFENESATLSITFTITNTGDESFTIKEVGMFTIMGSSQPHVALLERTVLDNPVTIAAGGVGQVTYNIKLNYPTV